MSIKVLARDLIEDKVIQLVQDNDEYLVQCRRKSKRLSCTTNSLEWARWLYQIVLDIKDFTPLCRDVVAPKEEILR